MDALAALGDEGCEVLCVIRPEAWPELMALREILDARGWLIRITLHNPPAM